VDEPAWSWDVDGLASRCRRATRRPLDSGGRLGPYDVVAELGRGANGVVYRAREQASGREVAVKVLLCRDESDRARARFGREGRILAGLRHPGIVTVHAAGEVDGLPYLAEELVAGARDLREAARPLDPSGVAALVRDAARAGGHAHRRSTATSSRPTSSSRPTAASGWSPARATAR